MGGAGRIDHVIVVMLENRAFDHLLGFLDHPDPSFESVVPGRDANPLDPADPDAPMVYATRHKRVRLRVDPDHAHAATAAQLGLGADGTPSMDGFVRSYELKASGQGPGPAKARRAKRTATTVAYAALVGAAVALAVGQPWLGLALVVVAGVAVVIRVRFVPKADHFPGDGRRIMQCWDPSALPAIAQLARSFALCTRWFSSVPGETWPNRQFAHAATSAGTADIRLGLYDDPTVFELLEEHGSSWRIYYDGPPQVLCYPALWCSPERLANWHTVDALLAHIEGGDLPAYSFVEPNHGYVGRSYSQHPGNNRRFKRDFTHGDGFVAAVYEALRSRPEVFARTVLVVTYDEHGGTWDRVPPPVAVPPDDRTGDGFRFDRLGGRVPALVVSPLVAPGTLDATERDHTTIPTTLRLRFAPTAGPLTKRDGPAGSFLDVLLRATPRTDDLPDLSRVAWRPKPARTPVDTFLGWVKSLGKVPDPMQEACAWLAARFDQAVSLVPHARGAGVVVQQVLPRGEVPLAGAVPPPRRAVARANRKLEAAAAAARAADVPKGDTDHGDQ